ncbi:7-cyano-7-deazaguanine synthase QueC [Delftia tsuruhatensis]|uniref:7-cyano-7-deazaguanine synthase QueC n=1 Tax=Delftia tsuruhatensis TaxID=180282 RepID=UPI001F2DE34C|nr:7-cyano-7-deazaguanine synthase QueC [Delftia tsuruhatensis]
MQAMQTDSISPQAPDARHKAALVLFSGGQDSTTCLAQALSLYERVETLGFDYGQRHSVEMQVRQQVRERLAADFPEWAPRLGEDHVLSLDVLQQIGGSSLTEDVAFAMQADGLPNTFVPGRNLLFLTLAGALAYRRGLSVIVTGVCETDYSGYPDCRDDTMKAMQLALNLGLERRLRIDTPLMWIDKAQTWQMAHDLGGDTLVELIRRDTHTCYQGTRDTLHDWGYGCATCPACDLRSRGWSQWQAGRTP